MIGCGCCLRRCWKRRRSEAKGGNRSSMCLSTGTERPRSSIFPPERFALPWLLLSPSLFLRRIPHLYALMQRFTPYKYNTLSRKSRVKIGGLSVKHDTISMTGVPSMPAEWNDGKVSWVLGGAWSVASVFSYFLNSISQRVFLFSQFTSLIWGIDFIMDCSTRNPTLGSLSIDSTSSDSLRSI